MNTRSRKYGEIADRLGLEGTYNLAADGRPPLWVAGIDVERAAAVDIIAVPDPATWILGPDATWADALVAAARVALDTRIARYSELLDDPDSPIERLHLYTNAEAALDSLTTAVVAGGIAARTVIAVVPDGR